MLLFNLLLMTLIWGLTAAWLCFWKGRLRASLDIDLMQQGQRLLSSLTLEHP